MKKYGSEMPPRLMYGEINSAGVPIALYAAKNDILVDIKDTRKTVDFIQKGGNSTLVDYHEIEGGHLTFFMGKDVSYFENRALKLIERFN